MRLKEEKKRERKEGRPIGGSLPSHLLPLSRILEDIIILQARGKGEDRNIRPLSNSTAVPALSGLLRGTSVRRELSGSTRGEVEYIIPSVLSTLCDVG